MLVPGELLSPEFLAKIDQLELVSKKILAGKLKGERRSKRKGFSTEFADHRSYVVGDDLRFIDWNILIRLDRLFIKLFEEEEDLHIYLLIDASRSMDFGTPTKFNFAQRVAAALAYIGLSNLDRVRIVPFDDAIDTSLPPARGRRNVLRVLDQIEKLTPGGKTSLEASCKSFATQATGKGIVVMISDLMDKAGFESAIRYLVARQMDLFVIHVLSTEEIDPPATGDLRLVDAEDGDAAEITVSAPLLARYKKTLESYCAEIRDYCHKRGVSYLFTASDVPFEQVVLGYLRERGLVR
ncbi:DUF58 domain-containing protein [bacterium]|nr:DUF58 domain-containing protein [bacterium]